MGLMTPGVTHSVKRVRLPVVHQIYTSANGMGAGLLNQLSEGSNPSRGAINIIPGFGEMDIITVFETAGRGSIPLSPAIKEIL